MKTATFSEGGKRYSLKSPTIVPKADTYMWNEKTLCHVTAQGFVQSQFMQPEPCFYSHAPLLSAKAAMAPEPQYFDHHPGRFFYVRDENTNEYYSAPYRPTNIKLDEFEFAPGISDIRWTCKKGAIKTVVEFALPNGKDVVEMWRVTVKNESDECKKMSLYPYFPIGFPSWMNTQAKYDEKIGGILAYTLTPYRKLDDYYKNKNLKDYTYLICDTECDSWVSSMAEFEGEGGLRRPDKIFDDKLPCTQASYESAACIMQFKMDLKAHEERTFNFLFGPANNVQEINEYREKYLNEFSFAENVNAYNEFYKNNAGAIIIETGDTNFDAFVNYWLPRQVLYHSYTLRMVTDPQTRNHIQDSMAMSYIMPQKARELYILGLQQQKKSGEMPDGILLNENAELKFTNQIPHRDHSVWWTFAVDTYINESGDYKFLNETVKFSDEEGDGASVYEHVCRGIEWLIYDRSDRGLCYIGQGDWNDPMNMVGHKGKGESVWLTQAMLYAIKTWMPYCEVRNDTARIEKFNSVRSKTGEILNTVCWDGNWYTRAITDDGVPMGVSTDEEGKIFLNSQSFGILSACADKEKTEKIIKSVDEYLQTPYGLVLLYPSYTHMREDVGRVTQKYPSTAENGSIYCHANLFYIHALYENEYTEKAFNLLSKILPSDNEDEMKQREHLPLYIPNYYRGGYEEKLLGKASHLMNTGALSWYYKCVVEGLLGMKGEKGGLRIKPQIPSNFDRISAVRKFRGKTINVIIEKCSEDEKKLIFNGKEMTNDLISYDEMKDENTLCVKLPNANLTL